MRNGLKEPHSFLYRLNIYVNRPYRPYKIIGLLYTEKNKQQIVCVLKWPQVSIALEAESYKCQAISVRKYGKVELDEMRKMREEVTEGMREGEVQCCPTDFRVFVFRLLARLF